MISTAFIGFGSNIGNRQENLKQAINLLENSNSINILKISSIYESNAIDLSEENPQKFLNLVCLIETKFLAEELFLKLKEIEKTLGRNNKNNNLKFSRIIDLDLLFFDDLIIKTENLTIPHPEALKRDFVLLPLAEIAPLNWKDPVNKLNYKDLITKITINSNIQKLS